MNYNSFLILVVITFVTGIITVISRVAERNTDVGKEINRPLFVDVSRMVFPVMLVLLLIRAFFIEFYAVPSGSMLPGVKNGDYILVNKLSYGLRIPVNNQRFIQTWEPARGDVAVFQYPQTPSIAYIKRIIGLPGDKITYQGKELFINGKLQPKEHVGKYPFEVDGTTLHLSKVNSGASYWILENQGQPGVDGSWVVPAGSYFVMGDNRDGSDDSRAWGFVKDRHLLGKAFIVFFSVEKGKGIDWQRIGESIK